MKKIIWALILAMVLQLMPVSFFAASNGSVAEASTSYADNPEVKGENEKFAMRLTEADTTFYVMDGVYPFASKYELRIISGSIDSYKVTGSVDGKEIPEGVLTMDTTNKYISGDLSKYVSETGDYALTIIVQALEGETTIDTVTMNYTITYAAGTPCVTETESTYGTTYVCSTQETETSTFQFKIEFPLSDKNATLKKAELISEEDGSVAVDFTSMFSEASSSYTKYATAVVKEGDVRYADPYGYCMRDAINAIVPGYSMNGSVYGAEVNKNLAVGKYDARITASDGSIYTVKHVVEAVPASVAVVNSIVDSSASDVGKNAVITDQNSDYVSIFVYGLNINKDSVRPVFYNANDEAITDEVAAVETTSYGAHFRLKKSTDELTIDTSDYGSEDYIKACYVDCFGYTTSGQETQESDSIINNSTRYYANRIGTDKSHLVATVNILYRPVYYARYDASSGKYLVNFGTDYAKVGTKTTATLYKYGYEGDASETLTGTVEEYTNQLTGQTEVRGVYDVSDTARSNLDKGGSGISNVKVTYQQTNGTEAAYSFTLLSSKYADCTNVGVFTKDATVNAIDSIDNSASQDCYYELYLPYYIGSVMEVKPGTVYQMTEEDENKTEGLAFLQVPQTDSTDCISRGQFGSVPEKTLDEDDPAVIICTHKNMKKTATVAPTCTKKGYTTYTCSRCGTTVKKDYVDCIAHKYTNKVTKKAGFGSTGTTQYLCSVCGIAKSGTKPATIAAVSTVKISKTTYTYNSKAVKPAVTVKDSSGKALTLNTDYTVTYPSQCTTPGAYKLKVTLKGKYTGSKTVSYTVIPKGTTISKVTAASKAFKVTWKKQAAQTTGYQIRYSTSAKMSSAKTVTISKNSTTSATVKKLTAKKKYYVQVRTYKKVSTKTYYSAWSASKTVTTKK